MSESRMLNAAALAIIQAVQAYRDFAPFDVVAKIDSRNPSQIRDRVRRYYQRVHKDLIVASGLRKTDWDFDKLLEFRVSEEMLNCKSSDLSKFELWPDNYQPATKSKDSLYKWVVGYKTHKGTWSLLREVNYLSLETASQMAAGERRYRYSRRLDMDDTTHDIAVFRVPKTCSLEGPAAYDLERAGERVEEQIPSGKEFIRVIDILAGMLRNLGLERVPEHFYYENHILSTSNPLRRIHGFKWYLGRRNMPAAVGWIKVCDLVKRPIRISFHKELELVVVEPATGNNQQVSTDELILMNKLLDPADECDRSFDEK